MKEGGQGTRKEGANEGTQPREEGGGREVRAVRCCENDERRVVGDGGEEVVERIMHFFKI